MQQNCSNVAVWLLLAAALLWQAQLTGAGVANGTSKRDRPVIVVLGTAGSGTRTIHQILQAAGVWMHPYTNKEFDSKLFIKKIKHTPPFGMPGWKTGMIWETRHTPAYYEPQDLSEDIRRKLQHAHELVAAEFLADVPDNATVWGWKEPQAIYTLHFLTQVFPNLHIIHQTRDGRDVALSNLNSTSKRMTQPYQRHYVKLISGEDFNATELFTPRFTLAAGRTWAAVNGNARRWALEHGLGLQGRYCLTRLEDFCDRGSLHSTVGRLLGNAGLEFNDGLVSSAAAKINFTKCQTARWQAAWDSADGKLSSAIRSLDSEISSTLELFGYSTGHGAGHLTDQDLRSKLMNLPPVAAALQLSHRPQGVQGQHQQPQPLVMVFVGVGESRLLLNWLAWLRRSATDMSRVLVVAQGPATKTLLETTNLSGPGAAARGPAVLTLLGAAESAGGVGVDALGASPAGAAGTAVPSGNSSSSLLQQQLQVLYELNQLSVPVLLTDIRTLWLKDVVSHYTTASDALQPAVLTAAACDVAVGPAVLPFDVLSLKGKAAGDASVVKVLKDAAGAAATGHVDVAWFSSSPRAGAVLRSMLTRQQQQQQPRATNGSDAHGPRNQSTQLNARPRSLLAALQHQLLMENPVFSPWPTPHGAASSSTAAGARMTFNSTSSISRKQPLQPATALLGAAATTAPEPLRVLLLPTSQLQQSCKKPESSSSSSHDEPVAVRCSHNAASQKPAKQQTWQQHQAGQAAVSEAVIAGAGLWQGPLPGVPASL